MDKQDYLRECGNQLTDINVYEKVERDPVAATNKKPHKVLDNTIRKKEIDEKPADYLYMKRPQVNFIYCQKSIREKPVYQEGLLFQITAQQLKTFQLSLISI